MSLRTMRSPKIDLSALSQEAAIMEAKVLGCRHPDQLARVRFPPVVEPEAARPEADS